MILLVVVKRKIFDHKALRLLRRNMRLRGLRLCGPLTRFRLRRALRLAGRLLHTLRLLGAERFLRLAFVLKRLLQLRQARQRVKAAVVKVRLLRQLFNLRLWLHPAGKQSLMMIKPPSEQPGGGFLIV